MSNSSSRKFQKYLRKTQNHPTNTSEYLHRSLPFNKVAELRPATFLNFLRIPILQNIPGDCFSLCCESLLSSCISAPAGIYLLKVNNRNTRTSCEICSKLTPLASFCCLFCLTLNILHTLFHCLYC